MSDPNPMLSWTRRIAIGGTIIIGAVLVLVLNLPGVRERVTAPATISGAASIGGPFTLVDQHGNTVTEDVLKGHYSLIYFGFTYCPDVCPLTLATMTQALEIAGPVAETAVPVFISIDPERDTPEIMAKYVANFHPRFIALTGSVEQAQAAAKAYRVYFKKAPVKDANGVPSNPEAGGDYTMDHSGYVFMTDPNGQYITHFGSDLTSQQIAAQLRNAISPP
jgi:cytochrome oxidase Cu insertion factor (SCO1/SenC/PrrC family)